MEFFDYIEPETITVTVFIMGIIMVLTMIGAAVRNRQEAASVPVKAISRIDKLKAMGETDALAELIANETDTYICRLAAKALAELGDERGKKILDSPIGETLATTPEPVTYGLGLRLLATITIYIIAYFACNILYFSLFIMVPYLDFVDIDFAATIVSAYPAYRWGWRNKYFISK